MNSVVPAKRFYKAVSVGPAENGWQILLDARPLKTPAGNRLAISGRALTDAIAAEWDGQQDRIKPETMPLFRLLATAIDRVGPRRDEVIAATLKYAETDLLCYRAAEPSDLVELQRTRWQPLLDWVRGECGAEFCVTAGVIPIDQSADALAALRQRIGELDDLRLTGVSALAGATGSLVLALALARRRIDAAEAGDLALLDEQYQADVWGEDAEARVKRERTRADIADTTRFLNLID